MSTPESKSDDADVSFHTPFRDAHQLGLSPPASTSAPLGSGHSPQHRSPSSGVTLPPVTSPADPDPSASSAAGAAASASSMILWLDHDDASAAQSFSEALKRKTRHRREQVDATLVAVKLQSQRLEAALSAEIKRRVDVTQQWQQRAAEEIVKVEERLQQQMEQDRAVAEERWNALEERLALLECKWQTDVHALEQEATRTAKQLQEQVQELTQQLKKERQTRLEREAALNQQMSRLSEEFKELWQVERQERFKAIQHLTEKSVADDLLRIESERTLDYRIGQELKELEREIREEQQEREEADQEIVASLNQYMEEIQKSLAYVSGI